MRFPPWSPTTRFPGTLPVLVFLLLCAVRVPFARADDTVRRAQEELRKRNLYFGDIDGVANRGTVGALKRYQDRKRLTVTGEVDGETLRALGIPSPHSESAAAPIEPDPWPEIPVLRSDQGRRPPPMAGEPVLAEGSPSPPATPALATGEGRDRPMLPATGDGAAWGTPAGCETAEPAPVEPGPLTPEAARSFLTNYLRDCSTNNLRVEMAYYADEVDYFNKGPAIRGYIRRDVSSYYKRWPERHYEILGPISVSPGARAGETAVHFQVHYRCLGPGHQAEGRTENVFTVQGTPPSEMRIVGMKERRVR